MWKIVGSRAKRIAVLSQLGGRDPAGAYERFVRQGIGEHSPWEQLRGQIWLGSEAFIERMQRLADGKPGVAQGFAPPAAPSAPER